MLPILIGSQALKIYGYDLSPPQDWDLVVSPDQKKEYLKKQRYNTNPNCVLIEHPECKGGYIKVDLVEDNIIYDCCNTFADDFEIGRMDHPLLGKILVAPLQILYAIKKGHIHRILHHHESNYHNVQDWQKQMHMYLWMRERLGYQKMDDIIYGSNKSTIFKSKYESLLEFYTRKIYYHNFDKTNKRVGDTLNSMEKSEDKFFIDGVNRFIEHDELHKLVAQMCRDTDELLFRKFQKSKDCVQMDRDLFLAAERGVQIQTIREEIIVLMLERKVIPEIAKSYKDKNRKYAGFNQAQREDEMNETIAHFICNLCGQGDHWLRRWCLDHYMFFEKVNTYDYKDMDDIAKKIIGADLIDEIPEDDQKDKCRTILEFIFGGSVLYTYESMYGTEEVTVSDFTPGLSFSEQTYDKKWDLDLGGSKAKSFNCLSKDHTTGVVTIYYENNPYLEHIFKLFSKSNYIYYFDKAVFDDNANIGIYLHGKNVLLFRFSNIERDYDRKNEINFSVDYMDLESNVNSCDKKFSRRCYAYYYYSHDPTCDGMDDVKHNVVNRYLSSYGSVPSPIAPLLEYFAREKLDVRKDEGKPDKSMINDAYAYDYNGGDSFSDESIIDRY